MSETETSSQQNVHQTEKNDEKSTEQTPSKSKSPTTPTGGNNWWGSWISQAKEKSASVLEAVKNDLNEITTAVTETLQLVPNEEDHQQQPHNESSDQHNTVNFANMKQSISSSISTFFGTVTDALIPQLDEEDTSEAVLITNDDTIVLTGFTKYLADLQANDETYLEEPSKSAELSEKYRMWLEIVEQDQFTQQRVDKMLEQSAILNEKYNKFVPDTVSHMNFFKRYLFKKALLEDDLANEERRRKEAQIISKQPETIVEEKSTSPSKSPIKTVSEVTQKSQSRKNEISDLDIANFEISEEEQARLLAEYELEIKEREKNKTDDVILPEDIDDLPIKPKEKAVTTTTTGGGKKSVQMKSSNVAVTTGNTSKGKNNKDSKSQPQQQQKSNQQQQKKNQEKSRGKKTGELPIEKDHFKKESESSTSDESWEKDFDI
ncbi:hypothetical protein PVAND_005970 [Polypedilum vanderplanki]|uniref:BSD domain-containing protein n=1 Tax=Polypedilum vanderplanki TaxID=319348 RepID=A0A9J6C1R4_POLVA|nr:hypothetical protein PVAND_005970 [Polypedilum vanderplanki]